MSELPPSWARARFADVADWSSGGTPSRKHPEFFGGGIPWVKTGELRNKFVRKTEETLSEEGLSKSSAKVFPAGAVGIAMYGATIGKASIWGIDAATNQACAVAVSNGAVVPEYLYYFLLSEKSKLVEAGKGGAQPNISQGLLKAWHLPLAPLPEQRRIVEKIEALFDEIDKGVESLRTAKAALALYRQSLLKAAFEGRLTADWRTDGRFDQNFSEEFMVQVGRERQDRYEEKLDEWTLALNQWTESGEEGRKPSKPKKLKKIDAQHITDSSKPTTPAGWHSVRLGDLNVEVSDGPFGSNLKTSDYTDTGVRVIRLENVGYGEFIEEKKSFISEAKYAELVRHSVYPGTIIVSSFMTDAIRSCVVPARIDVAVNKADCFAVSLFGTTVSTQYVAYYLQNLSAFKQLEPLVHGVGRPRINTTQLKEVFIPVCSRVEQDQIVTRLDQRLSELDKLEEQVDAEIARSLVLRQSTLRAAFAGKLVEQSAADEPASSPLADIRGEIEPEPASKKRKKKASA